MKLGTLQIVKQSDWLAIEDFMQLPFLRMSVIVEDKFSEAGRVAETPIRKVAVIGVLKNPHIGQYVDDLKPLITASAGLGDQLAARLMEAVGPHEVQGYGKGGLVGTAGEQEHASALLTTTFATPFRERIGADSTAWISSYVKVAAPGATIDIPMNAITDVYVRSHYDGMTLMMAETPMPDEIALIFCVATRGRLNARVGGMTFADSKATARSLRKI